MSKSNILILGDSFSADWREDYHDCQGWPVLLENTFTVTNLSQCGCSEYRIAQQLHSADPSNFDFVIVSHTSPYRLYAPHHPAYNSDSLHRDCDFLYSDVEAHHKLYPELHCVKEYFESFFDLEHAKFNHRLTIEHIERKLTEYSVPVLHIAHIDWTGLYTPMCFRSYNDVWNKERGAINHYTDRGNRIIADDIVDYFNKH